MTDETTPTPDEAPALTGKDLADMATLASGEYETIFVKNLIVAAIFDAEEDPVRRYGYLLAMADVAFGVLIRQGGEHDSLAMTTGRGYTDEGLEVIEVVFSADRPQGWEPTETPAPEEPEEPAALGLPEREDEAA